MTLETPHPIKERLDPLWNDKAGVCACVLPCVTCGSAGACSRKAPRSVSRACCSSGLMYCNA